MSRLIAGFMSLFIALLLLAARPAGASIEAPDHIYYGNATMYGQPAPQGTVVEARTASDGVVLRRHVIGSNSNLGNHYALHIPLDQVEPRTPGRSRPGDPIKFFLNGQLAGEQSIGAVGTTTRLDLDPQNMGTGPAISINDGTATEGAAGTSMPVTLTVSMNTTADQAVQILWETRNGTATGGTACGAGVDFIHRTNQTLNIAPGAMQATITVQVCGDGVIEPEENFTLELLSTVDDFGVFANSTSTITIHDDDDVPTLSVGNIRVAEPLSGTNLARFEAVLSRTHTRPVSFNWATESVSALANVDFVQASGTVTIAAGDISAALNVIINGDSEVEDDETFRIVLSQGVQVSLPQVLAYGTIVDTRFDPALEQVDATTGTDVPDLTQPSGIVLTPDGMQAYAVSQAKNAVVHFSRAADSGKLTYIGSYKATTTGFAQAKLTNPQDIEISADGKFLYVAAMGDSAVTTLARDTSTGQLSFVQSLLHNTHVQGLEQVIRLALTPDGKHVYAVARRSNAIVGFTRDEVTGQLSAPLVFNSGAPGLAAFTNPSGLVVSPDGKQVYATARLGNALVVFDRSHTEGAADFGKLTPRATFSDGQGGVSKMRGAFGLDISGDGRHVYVASEQDNSVVMFDRGASGALTMRTAWTHGGTSLYGLRGAHSVQVAPNGREVFVTGAADDSLTVFKRDENHGTLYGSLQVHRTIFKGDNGLQHLSIPGVMAASADNHFVYVTATGGDGAVIVYRRSGTQQLFKDGFE